MISATPEESATIAEFPLELIIIHYLAAVDVVTNWRSKVKLSGRSARGSRGSSITIGINMRRLSISSRPQFNPNEIARIDGLEWSLIGLVTR